MNQSPKPSTLLFNALKIPIPELRDAALEGYIESRNMKVTASDIITIMQDVCEIGQPIVDTVCPIIEVL